MRGGRRAGAGRPSAGEKKRVQLSMSVAPEAKQWMKWQSDEQGVPMGVILEMLIDSFEDSCKEDDL